MSWAVGMLELGSVAKGLEATDAMVKAAGVQLLVARTVCAGKWLSVVAGEVAAVAAAVTAGRTGREEYVLDELVLPNAHPSLLQAASGTTPVEELASLGVIETFSAASCLAAADAAAKAAEVTLIELRLPAGMGGKAYLTLTGSVSAVEAAVAAGARTASSRGMLLESVVIAGPAPELAPAVL